jgi:pyruvate,orthophosphate dikinase
MSPPSIWDEVALLGCNAPVPSTSAVEVVGNKAAQLIRMAEAGLPVPAGFVLPTTLCRAYFENGQRLPDRFPDILLGNIRHLEQATGLTFAGERRPLLVSVRSGAAVSMPGMMDTLLNVGLCDRTLPALIRMTGNPRHAWDSYRRLVQTFAEVVHKQASDPYDHLLQEALAREAARVPGELDVAALKRLTGEFLDRIAATTGKPFPQDPSEQLSAAVEAIFQSWQSARAARYRRLHDLDNLAGTAVTVQAMVFGNMGGTSGSGVAFSRDPATGENRLFVDFLWNAQGEDVVSGRCPVHEVEALQRTMPDLYQELQQTARQLERLFLDAQDYEFTVQEGKFYLLQSRSAKRTPLAALRIACDLVAEGLIGEEQALGRLHEYDLESIQSVRLAETGECQLLSTGIPASPGVAVGPITLHPESAMRLALQGKKPILVRLDMSTSDIEGLASSAGMLTARGGRTSHAAVVARQLNKTTIVGCRALFLAADGQRCRIGDRWLSEGDELSLDGNSGRVYRGHLNVIVEKPESYLAEVRRWKRLTAITEGPFANSERSN